MDVGPPSLYRLVSARRRPCIRRGTSGSVGRTSRATNPSDTAQGASGRNSPCSPAALHLALVQWYARHATTKRCAACARPASAAHGVKPIQTATFTLRLGMSAVLVWRPACDSASMFRGFVRAPPARACVQQTLNTCRSRELVRSPATQCEPFSSEIQQVSLTPEALSSDPRGRPASQRRNSRGAEAARSRAYHPLSGVRWRSRILSSINCCKPWVCVRRKGWACLRGGGGSPRGPLWDVDGGGCPWPARISVNHSFERKCALKARTSRRLCIFRRGVWRGPSEEPIERIGARPRTPAASSESESGVSSNAGALSAHGEAKCRARPRAPPLHRHTPEGCPPPKNKNRPNPSGAVQAVGWADFWGS